MLGCYKSYWNISFKLSGEKKKLWKEVLDTEQKQMRHQQVWGSD